MRALEKCNKLSSSEDLDCFAGVTCMAENSVAGSEIICSFNQQQGAVATSVRSLVSIKAHKAEDDCISQRALYGRASTSRR
ncbi:unnamed protein product [Protopolystoma xenopodis]|uniref:Uncharacterized protein n=1 Tax=Protopolystoma xenopodis TaxID=117903 RepID=A0A3S5BW31_9PLAT|nr:unnamed protein product [Protopolystoma xenopodis]